jgi:hypothetical protein
VFLQACLGSKAKDSSHIVQVTTKGINDNNITQPIVILGSGVRQVQTLHLFYFVLMKSIYVCT